MYSITINETDSKQYFEFRNGSLRATASSTSRPHQLSYRASQLNPDPELVSRTWKAADFVADDMVALTQSGGVVVSGGKTYRVTGREADLSCTCYDYTGAHGRAPVIHNHKLCKHILAVRMAHKLGQPTLIDHQYRKTENGLSLVTLTWKRGILGGTFRHTYGIDKSGKVNNNDTHARGPVPQFPAWLVDRYLPSEKLEPRIEQRTTLAGGRERAFERMTQARALVPTRYAQTYAAQQYAQLVVFESGGAM